MTSCCTQEASGAHRERQCAECRSPGQGVAIVTLKALLRPRALARLAAREHAFCATAGCPVVFFSDTDTFRIDDVAVPVYQKLPSGRRTVCYCFDVDETEIRAEIEATGVSTIAERIKSLVGQNRCACEVRNPQGSCCLGNIVAIIQAARHGKPSVISA
jgi:hypothetical protein